MKQILLIRAKRILKQTMPFSLLVSFSVYAWARILFYEVPFTFGEDLPIIIKTILLCWGMVFSAIVLLDGLTKSIEWIRRNKPVLSFSRKWIVTASAMIVLCAFLYSCNG